MNINFKDTNPGIYFSWPGNKPNQKGGFRVRALNDLKMKEIRKEVVTKSEEVVGSKWVERETIDEERQSELIYDYCIVSWDELFDGETAVECNKKNKIKLMRENPAFSLLINESIALAGTRFAFKEETEIKNFFTS